MTLIDYSHSAYWKSLNPQVKGSSCVLMADGIFCIFSGGNLPPVSSSLSALEDVQEAWTIDFNDISSFVCQIFQAHSWALRSLWWRKSSLALYWHENETFATTMWHSSFGRYCCCYCFALLKAKHESTHDDSDLYSWVFLLLGSAQVFSHRSSGSASGKLAGM